MKISKVRSAAQYDQRKYLVQRQAAVKLNRTQGTLLHHTAETESSSPLTLHQTVRIPIEQLASLISAVK